VLPSGLGSPSEHPDQALAQPLTDVPWLQPLPDRLVASPADPATLVVSRESLRLALVAALQHLSPRQRAVLILRDVLAWRAAEVAELLDVTPTAVNGILVRARARIERAAPAEDAINEPDDAGQRALLDSYTAAFASADVAALMRLLTEQAVLEMPPRPAWFAGRAAVGRSYRTLRTEANGQPALASYLRDTDGRYYPHAVQLLWFGTAGITRITSFRDPGLFLLFGLPSSLADDPVVSGPRAR
jgi:RNA polymerase sigma-70 factor (ECF subfamily)